MRTHRKKSDSESNSAKERSSKKKLWIYSDFILKFLNKTFKDDEDLLGNSNSSLKQSKPKQTRLNNNKIQRIRSSNINNVENNGKNEDVNHNINNFFESKKYPNPQPPTAPPTKPAAISIASARKARLSAKSTQIKQSNSKKLLLHFCFFLKTMLLCL